MFEVNNKYSKGDEVWAIYQVPLLYQCPICKGTGKIIYNGGKEPCTVCHKSGLLTHEKVTFSDVCKVKIRSVKAVYDGESVHISYRVKPLENIRGIKIRNENELFTSLTDARVACRKEGDK